MHFERLKYSRGTYMLKSVLLETSFKTLLEYSHTLGSINDKFQVWNYYPTYKARKIGARIVHLLRNYIRSTAMQPVA